MGWMSRTFWGTAGLTVLGYVGYTNDIFGIKSAIDSRLSKPAASYSPRTSPAPVVERAPEDISKKSDKPSAAGERVTEQPPARKSSPRRSTERPAAKTERKSAEHSVKLVKKPAEETARTADSRTDELPLSPLASFSGSKQADKDACYALAKDITGGKTTDNGFLSKHRGVYLKDADMVFMTDKDGKTGCSYLVEGNKKNRHLVVSEAFSLTNKKDANEFYLVMAAALRNGDVASREALKKEAEQTVGNLKVCADASGSEKKEKSGGKNPFSLLGKIFRRGADGSASGEEIEFSQYENKDGRRIGCAFVTDGRGTRAPVMHYDMKNNVQRDRFYSDQREAALHNR